jgi:hypothetical protein
MPVTRTNYDTILDKIVSVLTAANGVGGDLRTSMEKIVQKIAKGDPNNIPIPINMYPAIYVWLAREDEDFVTIGGLVKDILLTVNIMLFVERIESDASDKQARYLADNVNYIMRNNIKLDNAIDWAQCTVKDFEAGWKDGVYVSACIITYQVHKVIRNL